MVWEERERKPKLSLPDLPDFPPAANSFRGKIVAICHCHIRVVRVYSANHSVSIEDAKRVEDPILFERPCKCIEDARSLVPASKAASASKRNFSTIKAEPW